MTEYYTITEVSKLTGLAAHTIRYYEKQFPFLLDVGRSKGGHRIYKTKHIEALKQILHLLKEKNLSIRTARKILGEPENRSQVFKPETAQSQTLDQNTDLAKTMGLVLERLDKLCKSIERRDMLLETILQRTLPNDCNELLKQINRCRTENRETMNLYKNLMVRWNNSN